MLIILYLIMSGYVIDYYITIRSHGKVIGYYDPVGRGLGKLSDFINRDNKKNNIFLLNRELEKNLFG